jgi:hypothetical protein
MAALNMVPQGGFGGKLSFKKMSAGGRLCTLQENPDFLVPTIKVRQPDSIIDLFSEYDISDFFVFVQWKITLSCRVVQIQRKFSSGYVPLTEITPKRKLI